MKHSIKYLALIFWSTSAVISATPDASALPTTPLWCVVGGSRNTGYAMAHNLCNDSSARCRLFVYDKKKIEKMFASTPNKPEIIEGDVTKEEQLPDLIKAAQGASYLVIAQVFPYAVWEKSYLAMVAHCIAAAKATGARLVYFGRTQRYGLVSPIVEDSLAKPNSVQGTVLDEAEKLIANAGVASIVIRHSYPFGPNVGDGLLEKNFSTIAAHKKKPKQKFEWIASKTTKLQFTFLPDLAAFTRMVADQTKAAQSVVVHFAGITLDSIETLGSKYCALAGSICQCDLLMRGKLSLATVINKEAKRALDAYYSFENEILLDSSYQEKEFPFPLTSLDEALQKTYTFYAEND